MDTLMEKNQENLYGVLDGMRNRDVFLTADPDIIPATAAFPCIGIKDGKTDFADRSGGVTSEGLNLEIYYYDKLRSGDEYHLEFLKKGKLIFERVKGNRLEGYVMDVSPVSATPIKVLYTKKGLLLRKGLFFKFEREE